MLRLFISHWSTDTHFVARIVELLRSALSLPADAIRCTSVDGYRLPGGADTDERLRREVREAEAFIGVISSAGLQSLHVLFELGARWGAESHLLPLLAPGTSPETLGGPLRGLNALRGDNAAQLHQLVQEIGGILTIQPGSPASYQQDLDRVLMVDGSVSSPSGGITHRSALQVEDRPYLVFGEPYVNRIRINLWQDGRQVGRINPDPFFAHVKVQDRPPASNQQTIAGDALIWLDYYTITGSPMIPSQVRGRWAENTQPAALSPHASISPLHARDLKPNGDWHEIDLLIKHEQDLYCFGFGTESCVLSNWANPDWELKASSFFIRLRITATGLTEPVERWYHVATNGVGSGMSITERIVEGGATPFNR